MIIRGSSSNLKAVGRYRMAGAALGAIEYILNGHKYPVRSAAFSQDIKRIVSCSYNMIVRIWDFETRTTQHTIEVNVVLREVIFSHHDCYIESDRGMLDLGSATQKQAHAVFVSEDWVMRDMENTLWIPNELYAATVAVRNEIAVLGHATGALTFIRF